MVGVPCPPLFGGRVRRAANSLQFSQWAECRSCPPKCGGHGTHVNGAETEWSRSTDLFVPWILLPAIISSMARQTTISEADILAKLVDPKRADLSPDAARSLLSLRFDAATIKRIRQLLQRNNRGTISAADRLILEKYLRVGQLLDLLHAKAKVSLLRGSPHPRRTDNQCMGDRKKGGNPYQRFSVRALALTNPCFLNARIAYWEQDGWCKHRSPRRRRTRERVRW